MCGHVTSEPPVCGVVVGNGQRGGPWVVYPFGKVSGDAVRVIGSGDARAMGMGGEEGDERARERAGSCSWAGAERGLLAFAL